MFCPNCGSDISDNSRFCSNCGMQFQNSGQTQNPFYTQSQAQPQIQPRTRLGITVGMLGAVIWFSGLLDSMILVLLVGYVLFAEKDKWLKGTAVKAAVFYFGFFLLAQIFGGMEIVVNAFRHFANYWFNSGWSLGFPVFLSSLLGLAKFVFFLVQGIHAFKMKEIQVRKIDEFVEKYF